jgi:hypothetical protein
LKSIPEAKSRHDVTRAGAYPSNHGPVGRTQAARDAGLSEHQQKIALRVANVPKDEFERQVESDNPPTNTALGEQSTKAAPGFRAKIEFSRWAAGRNRPFPLRVGCACSNHRKWWTQALSAPPCTDRNSP